MSATSSFIFPDPEALLELWWNMPLEQREKDFRSPKQIAAKLGVSPPQVRTMADDGKLPAIKPLGRWVIHQPTVPEYLKRKK